MNDHRNAHEVPRRQFVALSGVVGASALLAGTAAAGTAVAAVRPESGERLPELCPLPPRPGHSPCPPAHLQSLCGSPADNDPLWNDVRYCTTGVVPPPPQGKPECLKTTANYVVLHGKPENTHNYLLSPSCRITGIECPFLETPGVENYWDDAWDNARSGGSVPVHYDNIGLGINSQGARRLDQLHIHMAGVRPSTQRRLQELDSMGRMATQPADWAKPANQAAITGRSGSAERTRTYRILKLRDLRQNLFTLLYQNVVRPAGLAMADQTLIVVPKMTSAGFAGRFYVLNSDPSLHNGTSTCDFLLVYA
ncbi:CDP-diacylglycerol diphosphatase [Streptomyces sp. NPDC046985]|uniref:CDP-diacylglycerol diphosphatase n=1 Tax=Streptomyces sp. NPDC046985 TaxID=3155377 RepID=UPI0034114573